MTQPDFIEVLQDITEILKDFLSSFMTFSWLSQTSLKFFKTWSKLLIVFLRLLFITLRNPFQTLYCSFKLVWNYSRSFDVHLRLPACWSLKTLPRILKTLQTFVVFFSFSFFLEGINIGSPKMLRARLQFNTNLRL